MRAFIILFVLAAAAVGRTSALDERESQYANSTSITRKLFTYTGPLLPPNWSLVSILNERVVIGFDNGTARNSPISELEPKEQLFLQKLQNGTLSATPLASAKEKLSQWSSSVSSTVSKFGKSVKEQFDSFLNSTRDKNKPANITTLIEPIGRN